MALAILDASPGTVHTASSWSSTSRTEGRSLTTSAHPAAMYSNSLIGEVKALSGSARFGSTAMHARASSAATLPCGMCPVKSSAAPPLPERARNSATRASLPPTKRMARPGSARAASARSSTPFHGKKLPE